MNLNKGILSDDEGESIGTVGGYVQQYKDIEAGKISTAKNPSNFSKPTTETKSLPKKWEASSEKEILLHYCKRLGCTDFTDLDDKKGQIASTINRLFGTSLTPELASDLITKHITQEDLFQDDAPETASRRIISTPEKAKERKKLNASLLEGSYGYVKGLSPLSSEQLDLCRFLNPKDLVFSSDEYSFFLALLPGKEKSFDKLFNFSPKEEMVFEMFKEQLGDDHKAKKLVLMSRIMNEPDSVVPIKTQRKKTAKKVSKNKATKKVTAKRVSAKKSLVSSGNTEEKY